LGLALSEKQIPQVVVNVANSKHRMERLEWLSVLAKQASTLSAESKTRAGKVKPTAPSKYREGAATRKFKSVSKAVPPAGPQDCAPDGATERTPGRNEDNNGLGVGQMKVSKVGQISLSNATS
jgi:hypothetical protein